MEYSSIANHVTRSLIIPLSGVTCSHSWLRLPAARAQTTPKERGLLSDSLSSLLDLHLPRFSISATYNLEEILPLIGLSNLFDMEADLSGIMGQLNKTVSRVRQGVWMWGGGTFLLPLEVHWNTKVPSLFF